MILHEFKTSNRALMKTPSPFCISWILWPVKAACCWSSIFEPEKQIPRKSSHSGRSEALLGQSQAKILQGKPRVKARETRKKYQVQREKQAQWCRDGAKSQKPNRYWSWVWSNGCKQNSFGTTAFQEGRINMNTCALPIGTTDICKKYIIIAVHSNMRHPFRSPVMKNRFLTEKTTVPSNNES